VVTTSRPIVLNANRIYVIGDIHGRSDLLDRMVEHISRDLEVYPTRRQSVEDLLWIRDEFLKSTVDFGRVVVHGHTPGEQPEILPNRINIDTGAFATGRLTCVVLESAKPRFLTTA